MFWLCKYLVLDCLTLLGKVLFSSSFLKSDVFGQCRISNLHNCIYFQQIEKASDWGNPTWYLCPYLDLILSSTGNFLADFPYYNIDVDALLKICSFIQDLWWHFVFMQIIIIIYLSVIGALLLYMVFLMVVDPFIRKPDAYTQPLHNEEESEVSLMLFKQVFFFHLDYLNLVSSVHCFPHSPT